MAYSRSLHAVQRLAFRRYFSRHALTTFSQEDEEFRSFVSSFSQKQIKPRVKEMEEKCGFDAELIKKLFNNGLMAIEIPKEFDGLGMTFFRTIIALEEISKADPALGILVDIHNTLINSMILKLGTNQQKNQYLPKLAKNAIGSFALTEETSGSDAFALRTTADRLGTKFVLNGSKMWISNSDLASVFIVMANVDRSKGYKGITCFLIDRDTPGLTVGQKERKLSIRASGTCSVRFDNVEIPEDNVLGEIGQGYRYVMNFLNEGRIGVAAQMLGLAQGCYDATLPYLLRRKQFRTPIFDFQSMQHQVAEVESRLEASRLLVYNAARLLEEGKDIVKESAIAKHYTSTVAQYVTRQCINWCGGMGISSDLPQEKYFRDATVGTIYEGTTNIILNTIAKCVKLKYASE